MTDAKNKEKEVDINIEWWKSYDDSQISLSVNAFVKKILERASGISNGYMSIDLVKKFLVKDSGGSYRNNHYCWYLASFMRYEEKYGEYKE